MNLLRGQRAKLSDLFSDSLQFTIRVIVNAPNLSIDFSCFGLDVNNKLSDERYMSFFNQPETPCGAVEFKSSVNNTSSFVMDLQKLPIHIDRLVITAAIDGDGKMSQLTNGAVTLTQSNVEVATFSFVSSDFATEKALMLMEVYRKEGSWRVWATGQGFNGGLDFLVRYFGGTVVKPLAIKPLTGRSSPSFLENTVKPPISDKKSENKPNACNLIDYWNPQGVSVKIANGIIDGGFLYFGSGLCDIGTGRKAEPALINPKLTVSNLETANYQFRRFPSCYYLENRYHLGGCPRIGLSNEQPLLGFGEI